VVISGEDEVEAERNLVVRGRTPGDLDECVRILAEVHRGDGYPMRWPDDPAGWLTRPKITEAWVAALTGRLAGHVGPTGRLAGHVGPTGRLVGHVGLAVPGPGDAAPKLFGGGVAVVSRLFVSPAARGHGTGKVLLDRAADAARQRGLHPVLDVDSTSVAAIAFYERLGWHLLGTSEAQWGPRRVTVRSYAAPT
jgi:GNAT superfamily N-acetyltransferase